MTAALALTSTGATVSHGWRRAMGSDAHIVVVGDENRAAGLLTAAWRRIDELEHRWSRFLPDSEVSALNQAAGMPVIVSDDTVLLVERARQAWRHTGGRYDPTVGAALAAHGYDRDFDDVAGGVDTRPEPARPAPGLAEVGLDPDLGLVMLPEDACFDPGGIGKGLAADLVVDMLLDAGAEGALVNLGGDLRAEGRPPTPDGWSITVTDPLHPGHEMVRLAIPHGAVATTSRMRRHWPTPAGEAHHLIDPATGRPTGTDVAAVTVVAAEAWWAEIVAKALFVGGPSALRDHPEVEAVVVAGDGRRVTTSRLGELLR
jgi:thiamine biosynthesis lipoprotein